MKAVLPLSLFFLISFSAFTQTLSEKTIMKLVREDVAERDGKLLGVKYLDNLEINQCFADYCLLDFKYTAAGSYQDFDYDLTCTGQLRFDLQEIETTVEDQVCLDN